MAESMCRTLRDGSLEGEQAPALTVKDTTASPFGFHVFSHVLSQLSSFILGSKSQSRGIVIVAFSRSPSFYVDLLKRRGIDVNSSHKWVQILDCYTDPLCWKDQLMGSGNFMDASLGTSSSLSRVCKDVKDLDKMYSMILELGKGKFYVNFCCCLVLVGWTRKGSFFCCHRFGNSGTCKFESLITVAFLCGNFLSSTDMSQEVFWVTTLDASVRKYRSVLDVTCGNFL
ncbi:elongator complex protein 5 isoform X4 [Populus alba x Populus x berolinensis]|uniref:Elongator complex protein 5 n=1 Tax=Populus alba x Populus x berolinensis TaxID=444605 RepID=A0AAD6R1M7_9ROSI|nr:elongator complex protein 5 isoform X4 [Populus alba x Populus x berolinensis]